MPAAIGNKTASNQNPNGPSQTLAHSHNAGADGGLLVVVTMQNTVDFTGITYDGALMTQLRNENITGESQRQAAYYIQSPSTGDNDVVISFNGSQFGNTSVFVVSFTGVGASDDDGFVAPTTTPSSQNLTIGVNSIIYASAISSNAQNTGYDIGGSTRPFEFSHNTNRQVRGALSDTGLAGGSTAVETKADFGNVTNFAVSISEAAASGISQGSWWMIFN